MSQPTVFPVNGTWQPSFLSSIDIPAGAASYTYTIPYAGRVANAWVCKNAVNGGAGDSVTILKGATAVCVVSAAVNAGKVSYQSDNTVSSNATAAEFAAGQTMTITAAQATNVGCKLFIQWEQL